MVVGDEYGDEEDEQEEGVWAKAVKDGGDCHTPLLSASVSFSQKASEGLGLRRESKNWSARPYFPVGHVFCKKGRSKEGRKKQGDHVCERVQKLGACLLGCPKLCLPRHPFQVHRHAGKHFEPLQPPEFVRGDAARDT